MSKPNEPHNDIQKTKEIRQFSESGVFVREDDQDWGSSGMNNIQSDTE